METPVAARRAPKSLAQLRAATESWNCSAPSSGSSALASLRSPAGRPEAEVRRIRVDPEEARRMAGDSPRSDCDRRRVYNQHRDPDRDRIQDRGQDQDHNWDRGHNRDRDHNPDQPPCAQQ